MKVAVIGGGIAGAELIRVAAPCPLEFTLIEPKKQIEMQALYPEYLGGVARLQDLAAPLKPFCERVGAHHIQEKALRLEGSTVVCERSQVEFDYAVIATGAAQNYFGIRGVENTFSINTLEETKRARRFVEDNYPERIMIMGSGLTGVEAASILAESLDASIYVIEARERVLPQFSAQTSELVERALSKRGVNILTSTQVAEVKKDCIMFTDDTCLDCDMAIWTAGVKPSQFIQDLDLPKKNGWLLVDPYLNLKSNLFAIGDCAWVEIDGRLATKTGLEAERQAKYLARHLSHLIKGRALERYSVRASTDSQVALISLGSDCAVGVVGKTCIGVPTRLIYSLKSWIDKSFIKRFK
ncbi:MAG TPA: FAD-dependent oxidoreductase [Methanothrix soehngenii]|jgi:NADH dehydrogenase|uniref:FAD-dependent pyridine nucleotide-disulfide oxidoreductase n=2 Tax=Methanothrix soehngenii TaxID=2223 RepID=F4BTE3_METSG|nr:MULTISPECIES: FAD-dependent oxidoreductase [Methanothrix]AEB68148.1 FAD-dependent pyridine nucleotide-disulfide oxidoreductase [Methanothrix soehngenii GP6]MBP7066915.1 FAD-dependent oxidoreductase [Methanothrix sp.]HPE50523.1 FAD-dependent oxidoreductase [Methanothrix soehngenii]HQE72247.1 FAD-dependent oxidoreductase [Methanothrix soehngenii]HRW31198.1 FAD-dependent oxidoreductase [Methanothrix sp.]